MNINFDISEVWNEFNFGMISEAWNESNIEISVIWEKFNFEISEIWNEFQL